MARKPLPYTTTNNLSSLLRLLQAERVAANDGQKVKIGDLEKELAKYCNLSRDAIDGIKRGLAQPSLPVAMKVAEFFNRPVEEIFTLITRDV